MKNIFLNEKVKEWKQEKYKEIEECLTFRINAECNRLKNCETNEAKIMLKVVYNLIEAKEILKSAEADVFTDFIITYTDGQVFCDYSEVIGDILNKYKKGK